MAGVRRNPIDLEGLSLEVQIEIWEERAGILEHDADMSKPEAEREACLQVFGQETLPQAVAEAAAYGSSE